MQSICMRFEPANSTRVPKITCHEIHPQLTFGMPGGELCRNRASCISFSVRDLDSPITVSVAPICQTPNIRYVRGILEKQVTNTQSSLTR